MGTRSGVAGWRAHLCLRAAAWRERLVAAEPIDPELLREKRLALSRMVPLLYTILIANAWGLAVTFIGKAPALISIHIPLILTSICCVRMIRWWPRRKLVPAADAIARELRATDRLGLILSAWINVWCFALYPYADAIAKGHIAFFVAITLLASMFCLIAAQSTALIVAFLVGITNFIFFLMTGNANLESMAVTLFVVTMGAVAIVITQNRHLKHMVNARTEARQKHEEQGRLLRMIDDMPIAAMTIDPAGFVITYANKASVDLVEQLEHLLPIRASELVGACIDIFHAVPEGQRQIIEDPANLPFRARVPLGNEIVDLQIAAVTANDGSQIGLMLTLAIVTKEVEAERHIWHLARYDALTQLPNRTTFHEALRRHLEGGQPASLLFIDLDGFKLVNDTRGHRAGDRLLVQVADRLRTLCEEAGISLARLSGDEFAVLMPTGDAAQARALATRTIALLSEPYDLDPGQVRIGASVGIALAPEQGDTGELLLARADIALYAAKSAGKGTALVFVPEMEARIQERVQLESQLREALQDRSGLSVFYQPIVSIRTGQVTAREALVRWHHPVRGWIPPSEFVPVAEQSGLIDALGEFVLSTACRDAATWEDGARVAINISATQLGKDLVAQHILSALVNSGLAPDRLEIEVTETALLDEGRDVIGDLRRVRALGVRVALDDFGTGFSSLSHLRLFPFDKIKIDGSFVKEATTRPDCAAIVRAVADLGRRLGVTTVAEGVETAAQFACVREEGCTEVQGYLIGRPTPQSDDDEELELVERYQA